MNDYMMSLVTVLTLGVLTTIQPCPLSVNFSVISLITGAPYRRDNYFVTVFGFAMGYGFTMLILSALLVRGLAAVAPLSLFLQGTFSNFLGPVLIVTGMILSRLLDLNRYYKNISLTDKLWLINGAFLPSMLLGSILALSFCPSTASIFFGIMVPLAVKNGSTVVFPLMYAAGVLLPLIVLSILIRKGLSGILPEFWIKNLPQIMGWIIIAIGVYITLKELYF